MNSITFENRKFEIREIEIKKFGLEIIASTDLNNILITIEGNYKSDEARLVDEQIYFFVEHEKLKLNDFELGNYIERYCV